MSNLNGATISKGKIGANRVNNDRRISGLVVSSPVNALLAFKTPVKIYGLYDAEQYGLTADFDTINKVNVYRHIREFFRMAGEGTELNFMLVPQTETLTTIVTDATADMAKRLIVGAEYKVRQLAIAVNPTTAPVPVDGITPDLKTAIPAAQGLAEWAYNQFMPCHIFLEGYSTTSTSAVAPDLRAIDGVKATKVTVFIGQDWKYAETKTTPLSQKFADVGTALGIKAAAAINQNIGDNEAFNLTDATKTAWLVPGTSGHFKNSEIYQQLQVFENKGYVFGLNYAGLAGVRINNDHVCAPVIVDSEGNMNEHTIAYGAVLDDCVRQLRTAYLPKIKKTYPVDATGKLPAGVRVSLESIGDQIFADMVKAGEISSGKTTIDPNSDLLVAKQLIVTFRVIPTGSLGELTGTINLKTRE